MVVRAREGTGRRSPWGSGGGGGRATRAVGVSAAPRRRAAAAAAAGGRRAGELGREEGPHRCMGLASRMEEDEEEGRRGEGGI